MATQKQEKKARQQERLAREQELARSERRRRAAGLAAAGALATAAVAAVVIALTAGGGEDRGSSSTGPGPEHIHGLGINPADGSLMIATHTGLFRAPRDSATAHRVGTSEQDVMGFTVVGPNRFLGSGHPGPGQDLPPLLGLIETRDAGVTWKSMSLLGEADFHVLRSAGRRIYGFNSATGSLMASGDGGRSWSQRQPPGPLVDLAINPTDTDRVIVSTDSGLLASSDAGVRWSTLKPGLVGLLTWPKPDRLYLIDADGGVRLSADGGRSWRETGGNIGGQPVAFASSADGLYAALPDATVKRSIDGGKTWTVRAAS